MRDNASGEKLFELLGELDEDILQQAIEVKDKKELEDIKGKESVKFIYLHPAFKAAIAVCLCVALVVMTVFTVDKVKLLNHGITSSDVSSNVSSGNHSSIPSDKTPSVDSSIPSESKPNNDFTISSIDMLNYYSAKKVIMEKSLLPVSQSYKFDKNIEAIILDDGNTCYYPINKNTTFTITMVTYYTINLNNENGFLAKKLGGTGLVEVVYTQNNLEDMITFKKGDKYYSCLCNNKSWNADSTNSLNNAGFVTSKYIEDFYIVKTNGREDYRFTIYFDNLEVTGMDCQRFKDKNFTHESVPDDITVVDDYCVVMFIKRSFTIDQLEVYFNKDENKGERA